jgi:hypothetical protein
MENEVRDYDIKLFGWHEPKHVALLKINPIREAKNTRVLFNFLEAGFFEAGMLKCVNTSYLGILVNSALIQLKKPSPKPTSRICNLSSLLSGREAKASVNMVFTTSRVFLEAADVEW